MKKVLVVGGAGFLGSHLISKLINNYEVYCLDNYFTGNIENINQFKSKRNFHSIDHDIINFFDEKFDYIYNLASPASPKYYQLNPIETIKTNILGSINLLELAKKYNSRIMQFSTSEVYGDPKESPQDENYRGDVNPIGIRACYDESKRIVETLFMDYHRTFKVDTKIIRIFNTYGPNMQIDDGRVISNFIVQALKNENITVYGLGTQTRSFCYVDDLIEGIIMAMNIDNYHSPINLGNPVEEKIIDIANMIKKLTNSKSTIVYKDLPQDDPKQRCPNINVAKSILNWHPKINLETGLKNTIKYFEQII
tara:strand:+ start:1930 stop:2856 length:927 start_codon:yes stop_codon:yes gene_type:complete